MVSIWVCKEIYFFFILQSKCNDVKQQDKYEMDARRILTVWGAPKIKLGVNNYAARGTVVLILEE